MAQRSGQKPDGIREKIGVVLHTCGIGLATIERPFLVEFFPTPEQVAAEEIARDRELTIQRRNAERALKSVREQWWKRRSVVGLSVAYRTKFAEIVSPLQYVIQVSVERKLGEDILKHRRIPIFPKAICGPGTNDWPVSVKVREVRFIRAIATASLVSSSGVDTVKPVKWPVVQGGIQVASTLNTEEWGTLGICLPRGNELVGITNEHVSGMPHATAMIRNPAGTSTSGGDEVFGKVTNSSTDQALVERSTTSVRTCQEGLRTLHGSPDPGSSLKFMVDNTFTGKGISKVWKFGARTGFTSGSIVEKAANIRVKGFVDEFKNVITFKGPSDTMVLDSGDSGSVLIADVAGQQVVIGLIFAQTDTTSYGVALPFGRVLNALRLKSKIPELRKHSFQ